MIKLEEITADNLEDVLKLKGVEESRELCVNYSLFFGTSVRLPGKCLSFCNLR